ncbi:MAG: MFS transporter [Acidobacteriota bacterium]
MRSSSALPLPLPARPSPEAAVLRRRLLLLGVLYIIQGLPLGFQYTGLPVYLRNAGMSLTGIGLASALALPWAFKVIWGPWIDRGRGRFATPLQHRRRWILPLQLVLAALCAIAIVTPPAESLRALLIVIFLMNLTTSTLDVAVDALAVDLLPKEALGYGNIAQVVGFKIGMMLGGGVLLWASESIGWIGLFGIMAILVLIAFGITWTFREQIPRAASATPAADAREEDDAEAENGEDHPSTVKDVLRQLLIALRLPGTVWLLLFVGTYKIGETMADTMLRPFLVDAGFTDGQIGLWLGTWGTGVSIAGSVVGGLLASRIGLLRAVAITAALRAVAVGGEAWLAMVEPTVARAAVVITVEQFFGGALTVALFAYMMSRVDRRIAATHYTLLATVEVQGKLIPSAFSGLVADALGYPLHFVISTALAVAFLGLLVPMRRLERAAAGTVLDRA